MIEIIILMCLVIVVVATMISSVKVVPESKVYVIERLGSYLMTWETGIHFKLPIMDKIVNKIDLQEEIIEFNSSFKTVNHETVDVKYLVSFRVTDAKLYTYGVNSPKDALRSIYETTFESLIKHMAPDDIRNALERLRFKLTESVSKQVTLWGIELKQIELTL